MAVTAEHQERQDKDYCIEKAPNDKTYKLELHEEYNGTQLSEAVLLQHGFKGGKVLKSPTATIYNL